MIEKLAKLQEGQVFKNYKELCSFLDIPYCGGKQKKYLKINMNKYFRVSKKGNKIIIGENFNKNLFEDIVAKQNRHSTLYKQFNIDLSKKKFIGVYCITLENQIYIGSTINSLWGRYLQHFRNKKNRDNRTYLLLQSGGVFSALSIYNKNQNITEKQIRDEELKFINKYRKNPDWIVVNSSKNPNTLKGDNHSNTKSLTEHAIQKNWNIVSEGTKPSSSICECLTCGVTREFANVTLRNSTCVCHNCKEKIGKSKYIKVSEKDYDKAIKILLENNINIVNK